jgi:hypothetical protein
VVADAAFGPVRATTNPVTLDVSPVVAFVNGDKRELQRAKLTAVANVDVPFTFPVRYLLLVLVGTIALALLITLLP